jgi:hypothetical protein
MRRGRSPTAVEFIDPSPCTCKDVREPLGFLDDRIFPHRVRSLVPAVLQIAGVRGRPGNERRRRGPRRTGWNQRKTASGGRVVTFKGTCDVVPKPRFQRSSDEIQRSRERCSTSKGDCSSFKTGISSFEERCSTFKNRCSSFGRTLFIVRPNDISRSRNDFKRPRNEGVVVS